VIRSIARQALPIAAGLFVACAVVQVFLAGLGVFDDPSAFVTHRDFGYMFGWLVLVIIVLALVGGESRRIVGMAALLIVLFALQSVFVALRTEYPAIAALHPLNGFLILGVGIAITRGAWALRREPAAEMTQAAEPIAATEAD
jgi:hypothetical protein